MSDEGGSRARCRWDRFLNSVRTLLKQGKIVSMNSAGEVLHGSDVLIEDDRIARIFHGAAPRDLQADRVLECAGKIVLPGLVSAHTHLTGMFQRGLWDETRSEEHTSEL